MNKKILIYSIIFIVAALILFYVVRKESNTSNKETTQYYPSIFETTAEKDDNSSDEKLTPLQEQLLAAHDNYTVTAPEGWQIVKPKAFGENWVSITLESPDYKASDGPFGGSINGTVISVVTVDVAADRATLDDILNQKVGAELADGSGLPVDEAVHNPKRTTVGQLPAVEYEHKWGEGHGLRTIVDKNGLRYSIGLPIAPGALDKYSDEYYSVVKSFRFK